MTVISLFPYFNPLTKWRIVVSFKLRSLYRGTRIPAACLDTSQSRGYDEKEKQPKLQWSVRGHHQPLNEQRYS